MKIKAFGTLSTILILSLACSVMAPQAAFAKSSSALYVTMLKSGKEIKTPVVGSKLSLEVILTTGYSAAKASVQIGYMKKGSSNVIYNSSLTLKTSRCGINGGTVTCYVGSTNYIPKLPGALFVKFSGDSRSSSSYWRRYSLDLKSQGRQYKDNPDGVTGYQIHAVYVVGRDAVDHSRDKSGEISSWLAGSSSWLDAQIGDHWQIDTYKGVPDVTYAKSTLTTAELIAQASGIGDPLIGELGLDPAGANRKLYLFYIESADFGDACGYAGIPSIAAYVATGDGNDNGGCSGYTVDGWAYQSINSTHEILHSLGVDHVLDQSDLMFGGVHDVYDIIKFDASHKFYYKSSNAGVDVSTLPVWTKDVADPTKASPCSWDSASSTYYCLTGRVNVVDGWAGGCWQGPAPAMNLEVSIGGSWNSVSGAVSDNPKSCGVDSPSWTSITLASEPAGVVSYRLVSPDNVYAGGEFKVVYQN